MRWVGWDNTIGTHLSWVRDLKNQQIGTTRNYEQVPHRQSSSSSADFFCLVSPPMYIVRLLVVVVGCIQSGATEIVGLWEIAGTTRSESNRVREKKGCCWGNHRHQPGKLAAAAAAISMYRLVIYAPKTCYNNHLGAAGTNGTDGGDTAQGIAETKTNNTKKRA